MSERLELHKTLVAFVEKRVGSRAIAEDLVQDAWAKSAAQPEEPGKAWMYRVLRNAIIDRHRRTGASSRALEAFARELEAEAPPADLEAVVCQCIGRVAETLPEAQGEALRRIEIDGLPVKDYAAESGISANAAAARVFRAREALRKRVVAACGACASHGCFDCSCGHD